jgi:hypothetical protein
MQDVLFTFDELVRRQVPDFDRGGPWKIVRHKGGRADAPDLFQLSFTDEGMAALELYQSIQGSDIFAGYQGLFAFLGLPQKRALFLGAYRVGECTAAVQLPDEQVPLQIRALYRSWFASNSSNVQYKLTHDTRFDALKRRVVVDWGAGTLAWHQKNLVKPVMELRDPHSIGPCPAFREIDLHLSELAYLYENPVANAVWEARLSAVGGIYLLTHLENNRLYVGKADSSKGFWGRWEAYAKGRSGNVAIDPLFELDPRKDVWSMSILEVVERGPGMKKRVDDRESVWKKRLRTRTDGYNRN